MPFFLLIGLCALAVFGWILRDAALTGRTRVHYEDLALARLRALAAAQEKLHANAGSYGWAAELERRGLLQDFGIVSDPEGSVGERFLTSPRYRLDVLLPHTVTRDDYVAIALRSAGKHNPDLESKHYTVVARPWGEALTGYRTFALDETGQVYLSEGVSDEVSRTTRPLPELHLSRGQVIVSGGLRWYPIDDLPKR